MYLRSRLALTFALPALLTVLLASYFFSQAARQLVREQYLSTLRDTGTLILPQVLEGLLHDRQGIDERLDRLTVGLDTRLTVVDTMGVVLGDSQRSGADLRAMGNHALRPEIAAALAGQVGTSTRTSATLGVGFLYLALPIWSDGHVLGALRVAAPLMKIQELETLRYRFLAAGAVAVLATSLLVAAFLGIWFTRPLQRLQLLADRIARGELSTPPESQTAALQRGELADLAFTMQQIASSLDSTVGRLKADQEIQSAIVSTLLDGVLAIDARGNVVLANRSAATLLSMEEDLVGRDIFELWRQPEATTLLTALMEGHHGEAQVQLDAPRMRILRLSAVPVTTPESPVTGLLVVTDITTSVTTLKMRRDFFNNASHELRTPLTSIIGYLETLEDQLPAESPIRAQFLAVLIRQADRMRRIVDDLLTLAQVESEEWPLQLEPYDLTSQARQLVEAFGPAARQQAQTLVVKAPQEALFVTADREKIHIVLSNLIDNAVKYAGPGAHIELRLEADAGEVRVTVSDDGPGIPRAQSDRIFERFYRLDKSRSRAMGGTGLGLSIVRHILAAHRQRVTVESDLGAGAKFSFRLPLQSVTT
jgi:two-component system phosphate regulon sensor histidine kinase PhoR